MLETLKILTGLFLIFTIIGTIGYLFGLVLFAFGAPKLLCYVVGAFLSMLLLLAFIADEE